jgi:ElaB/YqjD/DUF883 family membrane-anchored ribosome-binding protein
MMARVRERATQQLSNQKNRATDGLGNIASAVRQSAQPLRDQHHETIASYVGKAADQLEKLSSSLRERDVPELLDDARRFARERPAVFIGASFAAGLMAARFFKSSAENDADYRRQQYYRDRPRARRSGYDDGGW